MMMWNFSEDRYEIFKKLLKELPSCDERPLQDLHRPLATR